MALSGASRSRLAEGRGGGSAIKALVFDFDGLIVDTEVPIFRAWQRIYREHGQELPLEQWLTIIGTASGPFDPVIDLAKKTDTTLDEQELKALEVLYYQEATALQQLLPGVIDYLVAARQLGLKTAVASSSTRKWVMDHLNRFGIGGHFDAIVCREDVKRTKPDPDLYLTALQRLDVSPAEAIAFEDSTNGVLAAKAAGLFCVVVPNLMTVDLDLTEADLRLLSLDAMPLRNVIKEASAVSKRRSQ
jgi:HAD superfamily hydrolase (TIGR01509 family)